MHTHVIEKVKKRKSGSMSPNLIFSCLFK